MKKVTGGGVAALRMSKIPGAKTREMVEAISVKMISLVMTWANMECFRLADVEMRQFQVISKTSERISAASKAILHRSPECSGQRTEKLAREPQNVLDSGQ